MASQHTVSCNMDITVIFAVSCFDSTSGQDVAANGPADPTDPTDPGVESRDQEKNSASNVRKRQREQDSLQSLDVNADINAEEGRESVKRPHTEQSVTD